jgi:DNA segregation ATPase FtsK/SpoIIIE, S-DNA-T family
MATMSRGMAGNTPAAFFRRLAREMVGLVLLVGTVLLTLAMLSYNHGDPSWDHAIDAVPTNILGHAGAVLADLAFQSVGLAALILPLVLFAWSARLLLARPIAWFWLRAVLVVPAVLLAAIALSVVPAPNFWPISTGFGGIVGGVLRDGLGRAEIAAPFAALAAAALGGLAAFSALGLSLSDWTRAGAPRRVRRSWRQRLLAPFLVVREALSRLEPASAERREPVLDDDAPDLFEDEVPAAVERAPRRRAAVDVARPRLRRELARQTTLDLGPADRHLLPPLELLTAPPANGKAPQINEEALQQNARLLESVLEDFGVRGQIVKVRPGPVVTLYELEPAPGIKASRIIGLADDIARSMSAISARVAVIPGRNVIGIELPNSKSETVYLRELLATDAYERTVARLTLVLGKDIGGAPIVADLARMPHLLIAGTTGSGKSVGINTMILSILYRMPPEQCRFIMIDPKMLELSVYDGIPHLLCPVVTDPKKAVVALKWTVREMENRYRAMSKLGVRNIEGYNQRLAEAAAKGEKLLRKVQTGFDPDTGQPQFEEQPLDTTPLPLIIVVVDEMADLMLMAGKDIEAAIQRLAQMARAAGIHIVMATQRPSVDVITGTIKANFPTRVSFQVTSKIDSRTILGEAGAEQLLGRGDMLYMAGGGRITRVHGPFVSDAEVVGVVRFLKENGRAPVYIDEITEDDDEIGADFMGDGEEGGSGDQLYDQAVALVCRERKASTSFVQRHLQIGYNRAARIIERMESEGVVSAANHVGKREVLARNID